MKEREPSREGTRAALCVALASAALLLPAWWQSRVQAGDLSSHLYNAWLAERIAAVDVPGLSVASQWTNVLFDWMLSALMRAAGAEVAERVAVTVSVVVLGWGAFALVSVVAERLAWHVMPLLVMLAHGWVYHVGFFNFHLAFGLCLAALALAWRPSAARLVAAAALLLVALLAHALPVAWAVALIAYGAAWRRLPQRLRPALLLAALVATIGLGVALAHAFPSKWSIDQVLLATGADQFRVYDAKYDAIAWVVGALWVLLVVLRARAEGVRATLRSLEVHAWILCAVGVAVVPGMVLLPGKGHALAFISQRMSLASAVLACAVVARSPARRLAWASVLVAVAFFAMIYRDEAKLNRFEDRVTALVRQIPSRQRVICGVRDPTLRVNALAHVIDRACMGHCWSYSNYEPSTLQFRVRVAGTSPVVVSTHEEAHALAVGGYVVKEADVPLWQVGLDAAGRWEVRGLDAGETTTMTKVRVLR